MTALKIFLPLMKVDLDQRLVTGVATAEAPDRAGEICDYESSKPYFESWSAQALAASGGKSLGAVRAMHGAVAAGKLTDIAFDDEGKRVLVAAKIVDDDEWLKVTEGVYTGFSQGGRYVKRWPDEATGLVRYTAEPREISLVDLPCLPGATFEVVKDGVVEKRAFSAAARETDAEDGDAVAAANGGEEVDNVAGGVSGEGEADVVSRAWPTHAWTATVKLAAPAAPAPVADQTQALAKAAGALADIALKLERASDDNARLRKGLADIAQTFAALEKRVAAIEAQPQPAKAALRAVAKTADGEGEPIGADLAVRSLAALSPEARALALTKLSLADPRRL